MSQNGACNCCNMADSNVVLQFVSYNQSCSHNCYIEGQDDWLNGPYASFFGDSKVVKTIEKWTHETDCSYTYPPYENGSPDPCSGNGSFVRKTIAEFEYVANGVGITVDCPCFVRLTEDTSSSKNVSCPYLDDEGNPSGDTTTSYMSCNGGGAYVAENDGGVFRGGGGEFGGGGASGSWGAGTTSAGYSTVPEKIDRYITNSSSYFSSDQTRELAQTLKTYEQSTSNQLVVVFTPNNPSGTYDPFQLAEQYGVGGQSDNGIVIFVHPESKNWQVATGYGMEADFPDITVNTIMSNSFGSNASSDLFGALSSAIEQFTGLETPYIGNGETQAEQSGLSCPIECAINNIDTELSDYIWQISDWAWNGAMTATTITRGATDDRNPANNWETTETYDGCEGGNRANCPPSERCGNSENTAVERLGESPACTFEQPPENQFLPFPELQAVDHDSAFYGPNLPFSGYGEPSYPPPSQGYNWQTYRFARCNGDRCYQQAEQHVKYRVAHYPTPTCYLKLWFHKLVIKYKRNVDGTSLPDEVYFENIEDTYEWTGPNKGNNACANPDQDVYSVENIIYGEPVTMELPQPNKENREWGVVEEIGIRKASVIKGYEPEDAPDGWYSTAGSIYPKKEFGLTTGQCEGICPVPWDCPYPIAFPKDPECE